MARRRKATPVTLTEIQRDRLERLWFYYGNYGPETTPGNHQFIQGLLEHGLDLRPLQTKRTRKSEIPTLECQTAVEAVLKMNDEGTEDGGEHRRGLRLVPTPDAEHKPAAAPDPELKELLDDLSRRQRARREERDPGGGDAA